MSIHMYVFICKDISRASTLLLSLDDGKYLSRKHVTFVEIISVFNVSFCSSTVLFYILVT